jgi:hypothetical protein
MIENDVNEAGTEPVVEPEAREISETIIEKPAPVIDEAAVTVVPRPAVTTNTPPVEPPAATPDENHEEATRAGKSASGRKKE